ncbi:MAG: Lrp/AsnC family transcriptional regulator [Rhodobacteraceae bacterium]|nr:MAG: Lrp/AsnC family transcriptional regulator [Paracoccaceae bacterium]
MRPDARKISLDTFDVKILLALQQDAAPPIAALAERVGLSPSACHRRVKLLEEAGVIAGYRAVLDPSALGLTLAVFVDVTLASQGEAALEAFERAVRGHTEILECWLVSGEADYRLRVAAVDMADYERIHRAVLARLPGVASIRSTFGLGRVKAWSGYPVPP